MPNTHRRRRRDSTVELRRVGGVYAPVVSRDPVSNFLRKNARVENAGVENVGVA